MLSLLESALPVSKSSRSVAMDANLLIGSCAIFEVLNVESSS